MLLPVLVVAVKPITQPVQHPAVSDHGCVLPTVRWQRAVLISAQQHDRTTSVITVTEPQVAAVAVAVSVRSEVVLDHDHGSAAAEEPTAEWVDWYNHRRPFEYCDDLTPVEAEAAHYAHHQTPATAG